MIYPQLIHTQINFVYVIMILLIVTLLSLLDIKLILMASYYLHVQVISQIDTNM